MYGAAKTLRVTKNTIIIVIEWRKRYNKKVGFHRECGVLVKYCVLCKTHVVVLQTHQIKKEIISHGAPYGKVLLVGRKFTLLTGHVSFIHSGLPACPPNQAGCQFRRRQLYLILQ